MANAKSCAFCGKELESVSDNWETLQPHGGGEVYFIFSYGSRMFDLEPGSTEFRGVVCDDCAAKCMKYMRRIISL